jgi:PAS domain S-box-containing protein
MEAQHIPPESPVEEIANLRHCMRSLVALSTLPAIWTGRAPGEIAHSLADALFSMLRPEIAYVRFNGLSSGEVIQAIRVDRYPQTTAEPDQICLALKPWLEFSTSTSTRSIPHPAGSGELVLTTAPIGHAGEYGMVAACSRRADFPTDIDRLVLSLGANQVTTALQGMHMVAALRESEALFRGTFDNAAVGMAHVALDGRWLRVNDRLCAITGYAREELLARRSREITHPEDVATDEALARRIAAGELPTSSWEKRYIRKDGSTAFVNLTASALRDQAGQPLHLITIVEDITARKRAETLLRQARDEMEAQVRERTADLKQTNEQLQAEIAERRRMAETLRERANLLDLTHDSVFVRDMRDVITYWNRGAEALYGWTREEAVGTVSHQLMQTIFPAPLEKINAELLRTGRWEGELIHTKRDGTRVVVASRWALQRDEHGNPVAILETNNDITERKRAEEERQAYFWFLESMDRINRAMQGTNDLEQMMSDVLDALLTVFQCDRAWLVYPCDPEALWHGVKMQRTRPEFPGLFSVGLDVPVDLETADVLCTVRAASGPVRFGPGSPHPLPPKLAQHLGIQSRIVMALYPKGDQPYMFGLSQCSYPRIWTLQEERLFQEIGRRLEDALTSLLMLRNLQDSEARLEEAQRLAHVGYWDRDLDTDRFTWSDETYRIFGLAPQERPIDFAGLQELIHPGDRQSMGRAVAAALGGACYDVEYRVVRPGGDVRIVHSQGAVLRDESGRPRRMFGTVQDITERRRAEEELRESEQRYRHIFETAGVSIWEEDFSQVKAAIDELKAQGVRDFRRYLAAHPAFVRHAISLVKIIDVNNATVKLFGARSKAEMLVSLHAIFTPESQDVFAGELVAIAEGRTSFASEASVQTLQGDPLTVLLTMTFPSPPATLQSVLVSIMDITERKRAEYLTEQVFESSPDGIFIVGRDYRYQRINPVYERNWGMPGERIVGMHVADLLGIEVFEQTVKPYLDRCFAGEVVRYGEWFTNTLGRQYLALSYSPLQPDAARVEAALVITRDLTEHMLASEALRQAQAELAHVTRVTTLGELATSIAHEINQPLAAIVTNGSACLRWLAGAAPHLDDAREALQCIIDDGQRASAIITRIRALLRKTATAKAWLDINQIVHEVVRLTQPECVRQGVTLRVEVAAALPPVWGDRVQVQQVLLNLVLNAMEALAPVRERPREVWIRARPEAAGTVLVAVEDTGVGIAPEQRDQMFTAFYTTKAQGLGMGLAISRTIIEQHGGRLWVVPHAGPGATVQFTLRPAPEAG